MAIGLATSGTTVEIEMPIKIEGNLLGSPARAEKLLAWAKDQVEGAKLTIKRGSGISLETVASKGKALVYIYFDPKPLAEMLSSLPHSLYMTFVEDGIEFMMVNGIAELTTSWSPKLFMDEIKNKTTELLGMVEVGEAGSFFYDKEECSKLNRSSEPLSVFDGKKKRELSEKAKAFLARDAILNGILKK